MSLSIVPFSLQLPSGYSLADDATSTGSSSASTASNPVDIVSIRNAVNSGSFSAVSGDVYRMSDLFNTGTASTGQAVAGYRVALGAPPQGHTGGELLLNGTVVADDHTSFFTADEFAQLTYAAGDDGSQQSLVVVAQTGTLQANGTLTQETDSQAVQVTADVTGTRSIGAMNALMATSLSGDPINGADADILSIVQGAAIHNGFIGSARPSLQTVGNFSAASGDVYSMSSLFKAGAPNTGQAIAGYQVALAAPTLAGGGGELQLDGTAVAADHGSFFTPDEFSRLTYVTGTDGSQQNLVAVAQTGKLQANGTLLQETDSQAVQITADVSGSRSINAMNALTTEGVTLTDADTETRNIVQGAAIHNGFIGSARPSLQTDGNFTAASGDIYRMSDLFKASAPNTGQAIAGYQVALGTPTLDGGGGELQLNGTAVAADHGSFFTADEFADLTYVTGIDGAQQGIVAVAQTGTLQANGSLTGETDSLAVQITADVSGIRSINAMNALTTLGVALTQADSDIVSIVQGAAIHNGFIGAARPSLQTDGNFSAASGDIYRVSDLFNAGAPNTGQAIAGYRVALGAPTLDGGGGHMELNGTAVAADHTSFFTADEFSHLTYVTGADGSQQDLVVVAQTGTLQASGSLSQETDSRAVQITASVNGIRSINGMNALTTSGGPLTGADADAVDIVQGAAIHNGFVGSARPTLKTDGNFTAVSGDIYRVGDLFKAGTPSTGQAIAGYRVALGAPIPGGGGGYLALAGTAVATDHTSFFTADEFADLTYVAGLDGAQQSLMAVAQTGTLQADGSLTGETDSQAVQITAAVTGRRSINAMNALTAANVLDVPISGADADIVNLVQGAGIFTGFVGAARPSLQTGMTSAPSVSPTALAEAAGSFRSAGEAATGSEIDLSPFYPAAIGSSLVPTTLSGLSESVATALLLLDADATGAFRTTDDLATQAEAIRAYNATRDFR